MAIHPTIKRLTDFIRKEASAKKVRDSIADGLDTMSYDVEGVRGRQYDVETQFQSIIQKTTNADFNSAPEIIAARKGESNLNARLVKDEVGLGVVKSTSLYLDDFPKLPGDLSDSERFQRALNSIVSGSITLPMGTITFHKSVEIDHSKLTIQGQSRGSEIQVLDGIVAFTSYSATRTRHKNTSLVNLVIRDISFKGINKTGRAIRGTGFARGTLFENLYFEDLAGTIELAGSWSLAIRNCYQHNCANGITLGDARIGLHNGSHAANDILIDNISSTQIRNNNEGTAILYVYGAGLVISNSTIELCDVGLSLEDVRNVKIDGVYMELINRYLSIGSDGMRLGTATKTAKGVKIINSYFYDVSIVLTNVSNLVYEHNTTDGTMGRPIIIDGNAQITKSIIRTDKLYGVRSRLNDGNLGVLGMLSNIYVSEENYVAQDLVLGSGWSAYQPADRGGLKVMQDDSGYTIISGAIQGGLAGVSNPVAVIPLGMRPVHSQYQTCVDATNSLIPVSVNLDGELVVRVETTHPVFINLRFKSQMA